jgi:cytochrome P450
MTAAPIAPRLPLVGNLLEFQRDPLRFLCSMREMHGDVVDVAIGPLAVTLVSHPDFVEDILITRSKLWRKDRFLQKNLRPVLGDGLLSSEGDFWRKQRRLAQPAFHRERIAAYAGIMVDRASRLARTWRDGEVRDVHEDMMRLTLDIVAQTLFGAEVGDHAEEVGEALEAVLAIVADPLELFVPLLKHLPTPKRRRFDRAVTRLDAIIYRLIEERRKAGGAYADDLLSMLLHAQDEDGSRMSDKQLRDECLTLFLAGHETTALNLSWTWLLLSGDPAANAKLRSEVDEVLGDRPATFADLPKLRYTGQTWPAGVVLPVGDPARSEVVRGTGRFPARTLGGRPREATPAVCVLPIRRWSSPVHRAGIRPAGGGAPSRDPRPGLRGRGAAEAARHRGALGHVAAEARATRAPRAPEMRLIAHERATEKALWSRCASVARCAPSKTATSSTTTAADLLAEPSRRAKLLPGRWYALCSERPRCALSLPSPCSSQPSSSPL